MNKICQIILLGHIVLFNISCGSIYTFEKIGGEIYRLNKITGNIKPVLKKTDESLYKVNRTHSNKFIILEIAVGDTFESYQYLGNDPSDSTNWKQVEKEKLKTESGKEYIIVVNKQPWEYSFNPIGDPLGIFKND